MIVDSHVHLQPPRLAAAVREFFFRFLPEDVFAYPTDHELVLRALRAAGIGTVWNLPYAHKPGVAAGLNAASAELVATNPVPEVSVVGGCTVHVGDPSPADVLLAALDEHGLRVLKLHCSVGDYDVDDPRLDAMWSVVEARGVPTTVHAGHGVDGATAGSELDGLSRVAARFPGAPLIVAHAAHPATDATVALLELHPNVHADLTPRITDEVALDDATLEHFADRILFGSDAPNTALPVEVGIGRIRRLSGRAQDAILGGTARRLLGGV
ncbi:MAG: amidohydrolase family protein [Jatrophihabitans sp.]|uniref:amidohydrolase family protein n=1 Tax=Jatrophihabitans sp. TaxID=1932789 RepID=UPI003F7EF4DB